MDTQKRQQLQAYSTEKQENGLPGKHSRRQANLSGCRRSYRLNKIVVLRTTFDIAEETCTNFSRQVLQCSAYPWGGVVWLRLSLVVLSSWSAKEECSTLTVDHEASTVKVQLSSAKCNSCSGFNGHWWVKLLSRLLGIRIPQRRGLRSFHDLSPLRHRAPGTSLFAYLLCIFYEWGIWHHFQTKASAHAFAELALPPEFLNIARLGRATFVVDVIAQPKEASFRPPITQC